MQEEISKEEKNLISQAEHVTMQSHIIELAKINFGKIQHDFYYILEKNDSDNIIPQLG